MRTRGGMLVSVKSRRTLEQLGVLEALARGERLALVGPLYELRKDPGVRVRMAFLHDVDGQLCVGYADDSEGWRVVEFEPYSLRALGYYQRRLKRIGDIAEDDPGA